MASRHDTMMTPPIEDCSIAPAPSSPWSPSGPSGPGRSTRTTTSCREGLGTVVPPQVTSSARKPLSIAFEEIEADKILGYWPDPEAEGDDADGEGSEPAE